MTPKTSHVVEDAVKSNCEELISLLQPSRYRGIFGEKIIRSSHLYSWKQIELLTGWTEIKLRNIFSDDCSITIDGTKVYYLHDVHRGHSPCLCMKSCWNPYVGKLRLVECHWECKMMLAIEEWVAQGTTELNESDILDGMKCKDPPEVIKYLLDKYTLTTAIITEHGKNIRKFRANKLMRVFVYRELYSESPKDYEELKQLCQHQNFHSKKLSRLVDIVRSFGTVQFNESTG